MSTNSPKIEATAYQLACARNIPGVEVYLFRDGKRLFVQETRFQPGSTAQIQIVTGSYDSEGKIPDAKIYNYLGGAEVCFQIEGYGTPEKTLERIRVDAVRGALPSARIIQSAAV